MRKVSQTGADSVFAVGKGLMKTAHFLSTLLFLLLQFHELKI